MSVDSNRQPFFDNPLSGASVQPFGWRQDVPGGSSIRDGCFIERA